MLKDVEFNLAFLIYVKNVSHDVHLPKRLRKSQKVDFQRQFRRYLLDFGIILNDFWSSSIWAIHIQVSITEFRNPENPGIQPNYNEFH